MERAPLPHLEDLADAEVQLIDPDVPARSARLGADRFGALVQPANCRPPSPCLAGGFIVDSAQQEAAEQAYLIRSVRAELVGIIEGHGSGVVDGPIRIREDSGLTG